MFLISRADFRQPPLIKLLLLKQFENIKIIDNRMVKVQRFMWDETPFSIKSQTMSASLRTSVMICFVLGKFEFSLCDLQIISFCLRLLSSVSLVVDCKHLNWSSGYFKIAPNSRHICTWNRQHNLLLEAIYMLMCFLIVQTLKPW